MDLPICLQPHANPTPHLFPTPSPLTVATPRNTTSSYLQCDSWLTCSLIKNWADNDKEFCSWKHLILEDYMEISKDFPRARGPAVVTDFKRREGSCGGSPAHSWLPHFQFQRPVGFSITPYSEREAVPTHSAKTTLPSGISGWVNCPAAKRIGANLVFTSHQLKCFYFWRELVSYNYYWSLWQQSEKAFVCPPTSRARNRCSVFLGLFLL